MWHECVLPAARRDRGETSMAPAARASKKEGILFEKRAAYNATVKDIIPFDELEKNGIRIYSRWPDKKGIGPRVAHANKNYEAMDWDAAKDRHFVVNLKPQGGL